MRFGKKHWPIRVSKPSDRKTTDSYFDTLRHAPLPPCANRVRRPGYTTIGLTMSGREQAAAGHKAGVAHGGVSIEDPPGIRESAAGKLYLAYLRDPAEVVRRAVRLRAGSPAPRG